MSIPIRHCDLRKALDENNWEQIDKDMRYNRLFGAFSIFSCKGHLFKKRCTFTKEESEKIEEHLRWFNDPSQTRANSEKKQSGGEV